MQDMHIHLREGIKNQLIFNEYINKCLEKGLSEAVFLEHGNRISKKHKAILYDRKNINEFNNTINNFNKNKKVNLNVIRGIEIDYSIDDEFRNITQKILEYGNFEWIVGAIHSMQFENLGEYLNAVLDMVSNYNINVIAHMKLDNTLLEYESILKSILNRCHEKNICIEINTSDRARWNIKELYYMLNLMQEYNVNYVMSSDAHSYDEIGYHIKETEKIIEGWKKENCGYYTLG